MTSTRGPAMSGRGQRPDSFDATACPIIARHWFGVEPFPIAQISAPEAVADLRFRRQVERVHGLGPRAVYELLVETGEQRLCRTYLEQRVRRYAEIDPEHLAALGGDTFPRPPIYEVAT